VNYLLRNLERILYVEFLLEILHCQIFVYPFHEEYVNWFYLFLQDPYGLTIKRGAGTKDKPNLVPSAFDSRIVGCVCEDESSHINWMWLHKGTSTRCGCGFWFKLVEKAPV